MEVALASVWVANFNNGLPDNLHCAFSLFVVLLPSGSNGGGIFGTSGQDACTNGAEGGILCEQGLFVGDVVVSLLLRACNFNGLFKSLFLSLFLGEAIVSLMSLSSPTTWVIALFKNS